MTRRKFSNLLKPAAIVGSVLSAGVMLGVPALAQSEMSGEASQEIELSPEAFEILCERSPLNSRCEGGATEAREFDQPGQFERTDPAQADPAEGASDPSAAPVDRDETDVEPTLDTQPDSTVAPTPEEGTVAPKQSSESMTPGATAEPATTAPAAPSAESAAPSAPAASISDTELQQFAEAVPQIQAIERSTQQEVAQAIDESGISRERFRQLYQQQSAGSTAEADVTSEEQESFAQAYSNIQKIQQDAQAEREQAIAAQGLEPQRFDQILAAVLQDPALQQQVQSMMAQ